MKYFVTMNTEITGHTNKIGTLIAALNTHHTFKDTSEPEAAWFKLYNLGYI